MHQRKLARSGGIPGCLQVSQDTSQSVSNVQDEIHNFILYRLFNNTLVQTLQSNSRKQRSKQNPKTS